MRLIISKPLSVPDRFIKTRSSIKSRQSADLTRDGVSFWIITVSISGLGLWYKSFDFNQNSHFLEQKCTDKPSTYRTRGYVCAAAFFTIFVIWWNNHCLLISPNRCQASFCALLYTSKKCNLTMFLLSIQAFIAQHRVKETSNSLLLCWIDELYPQNRKSNALLKLIKLKLSNLLLYSVKHKPQLN